MHDFEKKMVITINREDFVLGTMEKEEAHQKGVLHRAFSIFLFRKCNGKLETLLQKRALSKYHSGGLWTNSCCSHAEYGVPLEKTAIRRLKEELGISSGPLEKVGVFYYEADVGNKMIEHEIDHVFIGFSDPSVIRPNPTEADVVEWRDVVLLKKEAHEFPSHFTVWFSKALEIALEGVKKHCNKM